MLGNDAIDMAGIMSFLVKDGKQDRIGEGGAAVATDKPAKCANECGESSTAITRRGPDLAEHGKMCGSGDERSE